MAGIVIHKDVKVIHCGPGVLVIKDGCERLLDIPAPVIKTQDDGAEKENGGAEGKEQPGGGAAVSAVAVSPEGDLLAVCDDRKQVCVFSVSDLRDTSNITSLNICALLILGQCCLNLQRCDPSHV